MQSVNGTSEGHRATLKAGMAPRAGIIFATLPQSTADYLSDEDFRFAVATLRDPALPGSILLVRAKPNRPKQEPAGALVTPTGFANQPELNPEMRINPCRSASPFRVWKSGY